MLVIKTMKGTMMANGHAYHDPKLGSTILILQLLVSHVFSEPFNQPLIRFAHQVAQLANKLSNGSIIVQRMVISKG